MHETTKQSTADDNVIEPKETPMPSQPAEPPVAVDYGDKLTPKIELICVCCGKAGAVAGYGGRGAPGEPDIPACNDCVTKQGHMEFDERCRQRSAKIPALLAHIATLTAERDRLLGELRGWLDASDAGIALQDALLRKHNDKLVAAEAELAAMTAERDALALLRGELQLRVETLAAELAAEWGRIAMLEANLKVVVEASFREAKRARGAEAKLAQVRAERDSLRAGAPMSEPTLRQYDVRPSHEHGDCGGVFIIGSDGYFSCVTDWGNYAFQWRSIGVSDFRQFLIGIGTDYLLGKIANKTYDGTKSYARIKETILELRRRGGKSKEWAHKEMRWLDACSMVENDFEFGCWYMKTEVPDAGECLCTSYQGQTRGFADKLWPRFVAMLKADLEVKARQVAPEPPPYEEHENP